MIKALIFDYFGVVTSDKYWQYIHANVVNNQKLHKAHEQANTGSMGWSEFINSVAQELNQIPQEIMALYQNEKIDLDLLNYVKKLHGQYKTALLTNASHTFLEPLIASTKIDRFFDEIVISSRLGMIKPNPKVFDFTLERLGVKRSEVVFIDDSPYNVETAQQLGIRSILYSSLEQLRRELGRLLKT